jgi:hypothetical protein
MHTSLRVIGVLPDLVVSVILGLCFCRWAASESMHENPGGSVGSESGIMLKPLVAAVGESILVPPTVFHVLWRRAPAIATPAVT